MGYVKLDNIIDYTRIVVAVEVNVHFFIASYKFQPAAYDK